MTDRMNSMIRKKFVVILNIRIRRNGDVIASASATATPMAFNSPQHNAFNKFKNIRIPLIRNIKNFSIIIYFTDINGIGLNL